MLTFEHETFEASLTDGQVKIVLIFVEKIKDTHVTCSSFKGATYEFVTCTLQCPLSMCANV